MTDPETGKTRPLLPADFVRRMPGELVLLRGELPLRIKLKPLHQLGRLHRLSKLKPPPPRWRGMEAARPPPILGLRQFATSSPIRRPKTSLNQIRHRIQKKENQMRKNQMKPDDTKSFLIFSFLFRCLQLITTITTTAVLQSLGSAKSACVSILLPPKRNMSALRVSPMTYGQPLGSLSPPSRFGLHRRPALLSQDASREYQSSDARNAQTLGLLSAF